MKGVLAQNQGTVYNFALALDGADAFSTLSYHVSMPHFSLYTEITVLKQVNCSL